jgi:hypothetical protein
VNLGVDGIGTTDILPIFESRPPVDNARRKDSGHRPDGIGLADIPKSISVKAPLRLDIRPSRLHGIRLPQTCLRLWPIFSVNRKTSSCKPNRCIFTPAIIPGLFCCVDHSSASAIARGSLGCSYLTFMRSLETLFTGELITSLANSI